jgi:acetylglutamate kinase
VAEAVKAEKLILLTDVDGVRASDGTLVRSLTTAGVAELIASGIITEGMIPKVQCGLEALAGGVKKVHMIDGRLRHAVLLEIFTDQGIGTEISR